MLSNYSLNQYLSRAIPPSKVSKAKTLGPPNATPLTQEQLPLSCEADPHAVSERSSGPQKLQVASSVAPMDIAPAAAHYSRIRYGLSLTTRTTKEQQAVAYRLPVRCWTHAPLDLARPRQSMSAVANPKPPSVPLPAPFVFRLLSSVFREQASRFSILANLPRRLDAAR